MKSIFLFLIAALFVACGSPVPSYHTTPTNEQDTVHFNWNNQTDTAAFEITSPSGIGGARIVKEYGKEPQRIVLLLRLKGLESLKFRFDNNEILVSFPSSGEGIARESAILSGSGGEMELTPGSEYWMPTEIISVSNELPLVDGYFHVELPQAFYASDTNDFSIEWVDFFR